jgi:hypothetical protein
LIRIAARRRLYLQPLQHAADRRGPQVVAEFEQFTLRSLISGSTPLSVVAGL